METAIFAFLSSLVSSKPRPRTRCLVTFTAKDGAACLGLKRDLIMLTAVITNYFKTLWSIFTASRFFCTAFRTALRSHQILLIKDLLFFLGEEKCFLALNTNSFYVGHRSYLLDTFDFGINSTIAHFPFRT